MIPKSILLAFLWIQPVYTYCQTDEGRNKWETERWEEAILLVTHNHPDFEDSKSGFHDQYGMLTKRGCKKAVPYLIEDLIDAHNALYDNTSGGTKCTWMHLKDALEAQTGKSYGYDFRAWENWWRTEGMNLPEEYFSPSAHNEKNDSERPRDSTIERNLLGNKTPADFTRAIAGILNANSLKAYKAPTFPKNMDTLFKESRQENTTIDGYDLLLPAVEINEYQADTIKTLLKEIASFKPYRSGKYCRAFKPEFTIEWIQNGRTHHIHFNLNSSEAHYLNEMEMIRVDIENHANLVLREIFNNYK